METHLRVPPLSSVEATIEVSLNGVENMGTRVRRGGVAFDRNSSSHDGK